MIRPLGRNGGASHETSYGAASTERDALFIFATADHVSQRFGNLVRGCYVAAWLGSFVFRRVWWTALPAIGLIELRPLEHSISPLLGAAIRTLSQLNV